MLAFSYKFLIQDVAGILLCLLGLKLAVIHFLVAKKQGVTLSRSLLVGASLSLCFGGVSFVVLPWSARAWFAGGGLCLFSFVLVALSRKVAAIRATAV